MNRRKGLRAALIRRMDWAGFVGGALVAAAVWLIVHGSHEPSVSPDPWNGTGTEWTAGAEANGAPGNDREAGQEKSGGEKAKAEQKAGGKKGQGESRESFPSADKPVQAQSSIPLTDRLLVRVYLSAEKRIETVPLETYVRGVVAAEMPLSFEPAALEAQALAARTYIVRRLLYRDKTGVPVPAADVTDTQTHQVYRSLADMDSLKKSDEAAWDKADAAARKTKGKILTYKGEPIEALYFASSNGYTENSEDVFPFSLPYLRSVASPWDREETDAWSETKEFSLQQFYKALGIKNSAVLARNGASDDVHIADRTKGLRVKTLQVGGQTLSGTEARDKLELRSAAFDLTATSRNVVITTYGNGHGVGMSQWGAEGMAKQGKTAEQIVKHYYLGIQVEEASKLAGRLAL
ncbi:stage II sporulation protein D [Cohnella thermotolerans]|uniref:stage II sporulation protein D n=1 Tax=Cohnella thermotolerans TaxID=329858 RepID=UPI0006882862|nr:stage II sporulation protein D [Cohnella thermotolerans]